MLKYDDASWHFGGEFPEELTHEDACIHMGMFLAWVIDRGHVGDGPASDAVALVQRRLLTGKSVILNFCDGKLTEEDLDAEMNAFARAYYEVGDYFRDLEDLFGDEIETIYHIADNRENYDVIAGRLDFAFGLWRSRSSGSQPL